MTVYYAPIALDYLRHAIRLKNFRYPLVVNPGIALSGLVGERKSQILQKLEQKHYAKTVLVLPGDSIPKLPFGFPVVAKPDQGERGLGVSFLQNADDWRAYHERAPRPYLVQEFVSAPFEVGVLFFRRKGAMKITSVGIKLRAQVVGDGRSTVKELVESNPRFQRQTARLLEQHLPVKWQAIPPAGEVVVLDEIRNHRRGAEFRDGRYLISEQVTSAIAQAIPESTGIVYGRADLRCPSEKAFRAGEDLCIVEVNGVSGEPAEIYDPDMSFFESVQILRRHWNEIAGLAEEALGRGEKPPSWGNVLKELWEWRRREEFFYR